MASKRASRLSLTRYCVRIPQGLNRVPQFFHNSFGINKGRTTKGTFFDQLKCATSLLTAWHCEKPALIVGGGGRGSCRAAQPQAPDPGRLGGSLSLPHFFTAPLHSEQNCRGRGPVKVTGPPSRSATEEVEAQVSGPRVRKAVPQRNDLGDFAGACCCGVALVDISERLE